MSGNEVKICIYLDNTSIATRAGSDAKKFTESLNLMRRKLQETKMLSQGIWKNQMLILKEKNITEGVKFAIRVVREVVKINRERASPIPFLGVFVGPKTISYEVMAQVFRDFSSREEIYIEGIFEQEPLFTIVQRIVYDGIDVCEGGFLTDIHYDFSKEIQDNSRTKKRQEEEKYATIYTKDRLKYFVVVPKTVKHYGFVVKETEKYVIAHTDQSHLKRILESQTYPILAWSALLDIVDYKSKVVGDFFNSDMNVVKLVEEMYIRAEILKKTKVVSPDIAELLGMSNLEDDLVMSISGVLPLFYSQLEKKCVSLKVVEEPHANFAVSEVVVDQLGEIYDSITKLSAEVKHIRAIIPKNDKDISLQFKKLPLTLHSVDST